MATKKTTAKTAAARKPAAPRTPTKKTAAKATAKATAAEGKTAAPKASATAPVKKPAASKSSASKPATPKPAVTKPEPVAPLFAALPSVDAVETIVPLTEEAMKPVEAAVAAGTETLEAVVKAGTQAATKSYEQAVAMTQEQVEKAASTVFQGYDDVANLGKDGVDACVQSSTVVAKGFETLGLEVMTFAQGTMEAGFSAMQALAGATTFAEVIELQRAYSRSSLDSAVAESAKLTKLSITLANDAAEPLQSQLNVTVEKMMKPLAA